MTITISNPAFRASSPTSHKPKALVSEANRKAKPSVNEVNISENVEFVGATGGAVYDVFVAVHEVAAERSEQDNYAYICAGGTLTTLDVSAPSNLTNVGRAAFSDLAYDVYIQNGVFVRQKIIATWFTQ